MAYFESGGNATAAGPPTGFPPLMGGTDVPSGPSPATTTMLKEMTWVLISFAAVFLALRLYCKGRGKGLYWDDLVLFASWLALLGNGILMTLIMDMAPAMASSRLPPSEAAINRLALIALSSTTLAIASQSWSKTSFAITLLRITDGKIRLFLWVAIIAMNVLFGLGGLFFWIPCMPLRKAWQPLTRGACWDPWFNVVFGIVVSAFAGIMDIVFALIPWKILLPLRLSRKEKWGCVIAMSMGVFAGVAAFLKCAALPSIAPGSGGGSMSLAIWGTAEPAVAIMAASIPAMRLLVRNATQPKKTIHEEEAGRYSRQSPRRTSIGGSAY